MGGNRDYRGNRRAECSKLKCKDEAANATREGGRGATFRSHALNSVELVEKAIKTRHLKGGSPCITPLAHRTLREGIQISLFVPVPRANYICNENSCRISFVYKENEVLDRFFAGTGNTLDCKVRKATNL